MRSLTQSLVVTGMTCEACEYKIKYLFGQISDVQTVTINIKTAVVTIEAHQKIKTDAFVAALKPYPKYTVSEHTLPIKTLNATQHKATTYYPLFLIFGFITGVSLLTTYTVGGDVLMFLQHFMTGFFLVFSFF
jgi:cation transport ATPase